MFHCITPFNLPWILSKKPSRPKKCNIQRKGNHWIIQIRLFPPQSVNTRVEGGFNNSQSSSFSISSARSPTEGRIRYSRRLLGRGSFRRIPQVLFQRMRVAASPSTWPRGQVHGFSRGWSRVKVLNAIPVANGALEEPWKKKEMYPTNAHSFRSLTDAQWFLLFQGWAGELRDRV